MANEILFGIVERQARCYNELIEKIIELSPTKEFSDLIIALKKTYGLDDFEKKASPITDGRFRVRPKIYEDDIEREVISFLIRNKGRKFYTKDIILNLPGRVSEHHWQKARKKLVTEGKIKNSGLLYWID